MAIFRKWTPITKIDSGPRYETEYSTWCVCAGGTATLRSYAHCDPQGLGGATVLIVNIGEENAQVIRTPIKLPAASLPDKLSTASLDETINH